MKTTKIILAAAISLLYISTASAQCYHHHGHNDFKGEHPHHRQLTGKTFLIHYTGQDYKLMFVTDSTIKWMDAGAKTTEGTVYSLNKIDRGIYLSAWQDKNGVSLSQVIDMHRNRIYTTKFNTGKIENTIATIAEIVEPPVAGDQNKNTNDTKTPAKK